MLICMQSTSVRIDVATHDELKRLAAQLNTTVGRTVTLAVRALRHAIDTDAVNGPINVTTPHPARNAEITADIGRAVNRPARLAVPAPALRLALGGFSEGVLMSQRVIPARLLESGFEFRHPTFPEALASVLDR